ncbi:MAG TPA: hypothetical protein VFO12_07800 [Sphingomicrobium sp.]|nr:hypothetical protein [Sphingomicrobium sp.]
MTLLALLGLVPALLGLAGQATSQPAQPQGVRRTIVHEELIISIPVRPRPRQHIEWIEQKGPRCIAVDRLAGAMLSGPSSIDFLLRDRSRVRAVMDSECPALDFYRDFYLQPDDERICAKRETIRSRVGGSCRIEKFRTLVPQLRQVRR